MAKYNIVAIVQRGLKEEGSDTDLYPKWASVPGAQFHVPEIDRKNNPAFEDQPRDDCHIPSDVKVPTSKYVDIMDKEAVLERLKFDAAKLKACYNGAHWKLGKYNFLDFVGTRALTADIDNLRQATGVDKLSFFTGSYGTAVAGSYAHFNKDLVDRFVVNGVVDPRLSSKGKVNYIDTSADNFDQLIKKASAVCAKTGCLASVQGAGSLEDELNKAVQAIRENPDKFSAPKKDGKRFAINPQAVQMILAKLQGTPGSGIEYKGVLEGLAKIIGLVHSVDTLDQKERETIVAQESLNPGCNPKECGPEGTVTKAGGTCDFQKQAWYTKGTCDQDSLFGPLTAPAIINAIDTAKGINKARSATN